MIRFLLKTGSPSLRNSRRLSIKSSTVLNQKANTRPASGAPGSTHNSRGRNNCLSISPSRHRRVQMCRPYAVQHDLNVKISHNTYIFFINSQFMKGLHNAFLEDIHVIMGVSIDNPNNGIFFAEANFNPKGFTTIKRFRQVMNVFRVYCIFNISAHSTCFCCWVTVE